MLLHLLEDEKFVDTVIDQFEAVAPGQIIYFVEIIQPDGSLKYVKSRNPNIVFAKVGSMQFLEITGNLENYNAVVLHNFYNSYKQQIVANAPSHIYFHWMAWGADLYGLPSIKRKLLLPLTRRIAERDLSLKNKVGLFLYNHFRFLHLFTYRFRKKVDHPGLIELALYRKIKSVSTVVPTEYELVRKYISKHIKYITFKYGCIEELTGYHFDVICDGDDFLIGNSTSATSNHLDAFQLIRNLPLNNRKVIVPLSYGEKSTIEAVLTRGMKYFNNSFCPLIDFMPLDEYNRVLSSCSNVVMAHTRQQAMGNILIALWKGARVYLHPMNPVYSFLKQKGIIVYKLNEVKNFLELPNPEYLSSFNRPLIKDI